MSVSKALEKLAFVIRVLSVPSVMAWVAFTLLYFFSPGFFADVLHYVAAVAFIAILPILAYPLQPVIPKFRESGRKGQRELAIIFSLCGYLGGILFTLFVPCANGEKIVYLTYFVSGLLIALSTLLLKFRASGHACGIAGPITVLAWYISPWFLFGYLLLPGVYWASRRLKRHTMGELLAGGVISVAAFFCSLFTIRLLARV